MHLAVAEKSERLPRLKIPDTDCSVFLGVTHGLIGVSDVLVKDESVDCMSPGTRRIRISTQCASSSAFY